jgi:hypothetical protein
MLRVSDFILGHEWKKPMRFDGRVTLVDSLLTDLMNQPLDRLGLDLQVGKFGQVVGRLLIRKTVDAGMNDFLLNARAEAANVNAERLILREKKPADIGGNWRRVVSIPRLRAWS